MLKNKIRRKEGREGRREGGRETKITLPKGCHKGSRVPKGTNLDQIIMTDESKAYPLWLEIKN